MSMRRLMLSCVLAAVLILFIWISVARADDPSTTYLGGGWHDANSWSDGVPDYNMVAIIPITCVVNARDCQAKRVELSGMGFLDIWGSLFIKERLDMSEEYFIIKVNGPGRLKCPRIEGRGSLQVNGGIVYVNYMVGLTVNLNPDVGFWQRIIHCPEF